MDRTITGIYSHWNPTAAADLQEKFDVDPSFVWKYFNRIALPIAIVIAIVLFFLVGGETILSRVGGSLLLGFIAYIIMFGMAYKVALDAKRRVADQKLYYDKCVKRVCPEDDDEECKKKAHVDCKISADEKAAERQSQRALIDSLRRR